ncbi:MAG: SufD family Fe-S cluster assembly protein [Alphaproteobacteria bacterium]|nr:SufD family Fe-S cluster assembly protein [Alphaproteobacteria bacterium]
MQHLFEKFNIKTFPANNIVFVDGIFRPDLSSNCKKYKVQDTSVSIHNSDKLPFHIIYVGNITSENTLFVNILSENTGVFLTAKNECRQVLPVPAFLQIFIKNSGKNSAFDGDMVLQNYGNLKLDIRADHLAENTIIFVKNRILAHSGSSTESTGLANIITGCSDCQSDISFIAMCAPDIKQIKMSPNQKIASTPEMAEHSASIYRGTKQQTVFLSQAGLSPEDIQNILKDAFINH